MKETDKEFVERMQKLFPMRGLDRLFALARRGADAADEIERLKAEVSALNHAEVKLLVQVDEQDAEIERLRAALRECEVELDAYYRAEYPGDHPFSIKKLKEAMASNPARAALKEDGDE